MRKRLERHMIEPIRQLMLKNMQLDVITEEFTAGYGKADIVGAIISKENHLDRKLIGLSIPLDHLPFIEVLLALQPNVWKNMEYLVDRVSFSESTLFRKVLPKMISNGLIQKDPAGKLRLLLRPPHPTECIVAIELKQTKWRQAILQARRYTFFANQSYIAIWNGNVQSVDHVFLNRHRIGLIGVEPDFAEILLEAPRLVPREQKMNRFCAEYLYRKLLESSEN